PQPAVTPTNNGIAVDFVKQGASTSFTWRVQLQGPNGHKPGAAGASDRWCATVAGVQGKVFVPYTDFWTECWGATEAEKGTRYNRDPSSAVVFTVPGSPTPTDYDFCVNGFADGNSEADAPDGPAVAGDQTGTVGGTGSRDLDFDRAKIVVGG